MNHKWDFIFPLIISVVVLITFWPLTQSFFQQDEWAIFGNVIYSNLVFKNVIGVILPFSGLSHFTPWTRILTKFTLDFFRLNFPYYAYLAIFFQIINSLLVFYLAKVLSKNNVIAVSAALLFGTSSISHQATTWMATNIGTQGSAIFLFLCIIFFVKYLLESNKKLFIILSVIFWFISMGFKESGVIVLLLFPVLWFFYKNKKRIFSFLKDFLPLFAVVFIYLLVRIFVNLTAPPAAGAEQLTQPKPIIYLFRLVADPLRALSQSFIPERNLLDFSGELIRQSYPQFLTDTKVPDPYILVGVAADIVSFFFSIIIALLSFIYLKVSKDSLLKRTIIFSLAFIITSVTPLVVIPGRAGFFTVFEPRDLYLPVLGSSIFIAVFIFLISSNLKLVLKEKRYAMALIAFLVFFITIFNIKNIRGDLRAINNRGEIRKEILTQISNHYPKLPKKVVFYAESNLAYYGLPPEETILPFQSGFGQTLLIWYVNKGEQFPSCFFIPQEDYLYNIYAQNYKFCQGRGFGYFRKFNDLKKALKENNLSPNDVIAFRFSWETNSLSEITTEIRSRLNGIE